VFRRFSFFLLCFGAFSSVFLGIILRVHFTSCNGNGLSLYLHHTFVYSVVVTCNSSHRDKNTQVTRKKVFLLRDASTTHILHMTAAFDTIKQSIL